MYSSRTFVSIRNFTRKLGLNKLAGRILSHRDYEDRFGPEMLAEVGEGDCVWDIGANVGLYTLQFAERAGDKGMVIAFEPIAACFNQIEEKTKDRFGIFPMNVAMGALDGEITMALEDDELAPTHRVAAPDGPVVTGDSCTVAVRSGVSVVEEHPEWFPNVIKIDVEGHEGAVIDGLTGLLSDSRLHSIGIEVHFGLLEERGEGEQPRIIEELLELNKFSVRWTDVSHLIATR